MLKGFASSKTGDGCCLGEGKGGCESRNDIPHLSRPSLLRKVRAEGFIGTSAQAFAVFKERWTRCLLDCFRS